MLLISHSPRFSMPFSDAGSQLAGGTHTILHYTYFWNGGTCTNIKLIVKKFSKVDRGTCPRSLCSTTAPGDAIDQNQKHHES